jgi:uncharacterized membrane protein
MRPDNEPDEPTIFSAIITPHRSLGTTGFLLVMLLVGGVSFAAGTLFFLLGAWPVVGFLGLDVLLIYWAFRANYRAAAAYEQVTLTPSELKVRRVTHRGHVSEWTLNPLWSRIDRETNPEFGIQRLFLVSRAKKLSIAGFLGAQEKECFAVALAAALGEAKRRPTRSLLH